MQKFRLALYITIVFLLLVTSVIAKELKYKVADIPKELRENARSVVRTDINEFEIKSISHAVYRVTYAITVLNKNGIDDAQFIQYYDKFSHISGISGRIYNEYGEQVKRIPFDEIVDNSAISGFSIYDDNRVKYYDPNYRTVPFTFEYTFEISYNSLFTYPNWSPLCSPYYSISTEQSSFKVILPKEFKLQYKEKNLPIKAILTQKGDKQEYFWEMRNIKALIDEPMQVSSRDFNPIVELAPVDFEYDGYVGNLKSWENLGGWISTLNEGKNNLTEESKNEIRNLVKEATTEYEKVKILYEYMQGKTRYVSIQLGIGGFQPFEAATVHRLSYGDCKALSNYMKTLLEVVGIKSNYILVYAGDEPFELMKDFPSSQFNHACLCVPFKNDTLWLECTSQRMPCGYISDFTDDRDVLLVDKDNSKIVHTKAYTAEDNIESRTANIKFLTINGGEAIVKTNYKGQNYDQILPIFLSDDTDKKKRINNRINLPSFQLKDFAYTEHRAIIPSFDEILNISFENYGTIAGQRVFFPLNFMNRFSAITDRVRNRKTDVFVRRPYTEIDTVVYELPANLKIEGIPQPVEIKTQFGIYRAKAEVVDKKIVYSRFFQMNKGKYSPAAYTELLDFYENISKADRVQCSLVL